MDPRAQVQASPTPSPRKRPAPTFPGYDSPQKSSRSGSRRSSAGERSSDSASILSDGRVGKHLDDYYGKRCWVCALTRGSLTEICHVIPNADRDFDDMRRLGLIEFERLDSLNNAIPLCGTCHAAMDTDHPYFIILPTNLD